MTYPVSSGPTRRHTRRWPLVVIPGVAFALGVGAAFAVAKSRGEPFRGVYRQEAVSVVADRPGRVTAIVSSQGGSVAPGHRLAMLEDAAAAARVTTLAERRSDLARDLDVAARKAAAVLTLRGAPLDKDRLETRLRFADLLRTQLDVRTRLRALEHEGSGEPIARGDMVFQPVSVEISPRVARLNLADARNHDEVVGTQIALCEERLAELDRALAALPVQIERAFEVDRLRADLAAVTAEYEGLRGLSSEATVASPVHGRVGVFRCRVGDAVAAGDTLVQVFDAERPFVLLVLPLADATALTTGRNVRVAFEGLDLKKPLFGTVASVQSEAETDAEAATNPDSLSAKVRIMPSGRLWPEIAPGTAALVYPEG